MFVGRPMKENFEKLNERILNCVKETDLDTFFATLKNIQGNTLISGVGGSSIVANYMAKVLNKKNKISCLAVSPSDINKMDLSAYQNIIAISYSGNNIGVKASFENNLNKFLFSTAKIDEVNCLQYTNSDKELSYISLAGTLIGLSLLFLYYSDNNQKLLKEILEKEYLYQAQENDVYEVLGSYHSSTASKVFESTMVESAIGIPILHDKYNYCHGRINLNRKYGSEIIYFKEDTDLDYLFNQQLNLMYKRVVIIEKEYDDPIINDFYDCVYAYRICKEIALLKNIDLSMIKEAENNDLFYLFKGGM